MTLAELKQAILDGTVDNRFMIFKCPQNTYVANQYIKEICSIRGCEINKIKSINELNSSALSLVMGYENYINILNVETFNEIAFDYDDCKDIIVICEKIDKKIEPKVKPYIIDFGKLVDWQVIDYMKFYSAGLNEDEYKWLYEACSGDIYKITNELDKLNLFKECERHEILDGLRYSKGSDLYSKTILDLSNAILRKDYLTLSDYLLHRECLKLDPIALTNLLLGSFKKILMVRFNSGKTPEQLDMTPRQFGYIQNTSDYNHLTFNSVKSKVKFLSEIDFRLKNNELDMSNDIFVDYLICNLLN